MPLVEDRGRFSLSGQGTGVSAFGGVIDARAAKNYAYMEYATYSPSAILILQASKDGSAWMNVLTVTGTPTTGTAQISAFYPYVRVAYSTGWSTTASANAFYQPGIN